LSTDVLGVVIEKAAGMTLPEAVKRYITDPLGMSDTTFVVKDAGRLAAAYRDGETKAMRMDDKRDFLPIGTRPPVSPARALDPKAYPSGGAGMSGTAEDYLRFLEVIRTGGAPILGPESAAALTEHAVGDLRAWTEGEGWGFSLGNAVLLDPKAAATPQNAGTWQWGGALGSHWFVDPVAKLTVVVLTNTSIAGVIGAFPAEIRDAIYADGEG
jgi:CubicO group peptidase (beta-lactamase class C family)